MCRLRNRYSSVLKEFGWFNQSKWLDVRGNHDAFVHYPEPHPYKLHMVYGVAGKSSVYSHTVTTSSGKLRFIGIDANGPLFRHFNGFITREMLDALEHLFQSESYDAHLPSFPSLPTILFTHYPLFTMDLRARSSQNHSLKDLIKQHKPRFYLCGHMHSALGGMIVAPATPLNRRRLASSTQSRPNCSTSKSLISFVCTPISAGNSPS